MSGNLVIGSSVIGCSSFAISAEHDCRTRPLMIMVQAPQTSSRQLESHTTGEVALPSAVTGLRWISIRHEMTFAPRCGSTAKSSQCWLPGTPRLMRRRILSAMVSGTSQS